MLSLISNGFANKTKQMNLNQCNFTEYFGLDKMVHFKHIA